MTYFVHPNMEVVWLKPKQSIFQLLSPNNILFSAKCCHSWVDKTHHCSFNFDSILNFEIFVFLSKFIQFNNFLNTQLFKVKTITDHHFKTNFLPKKLFTKTSVQRDVSQLWSWPFKNIKKQTLNSVNHTDNKQTQTINEKKQTSGYKLMYVPFVPRNS